MSKKKSILPVPETLDEFVGWLRCWRSAISEWDAAEMLESDFVACASVVHEAEVLAHRFALGELPTIRHRDLLPQEALAVLGRLLDASEMKPTELLGLDAELTVAQAAARINVS